MKLIQKNKRLYQLKKGNKIMFNILSSKCGTRFNSFQNNLGIVVDSKSIDDCVKETFSRINIMNVEFEKRLIKL
jgi:hypothetical protein